MVHPLNIFLVKKIYIYAKCFGEKGVKFSLAKH